MPKSRLGVILIPNHHHTDPRKHEEETKATTWAPCTLSSSRGEIESVCVCIAADVFG